MKPVLTSETIKQTCEKVTNVMGGKTEQVFLNWCSGNLKKIVDERFEGKDYTGEDLVSEEFTNHVRDKFVEWIKGL